MAAHIVARRFMLPPSLADIVQGLLAMMRYRAPSRKAFVDGLMGDGMDGPRPRRTHISGGTVQGPASRDFSAYARADIVSAYTRDDCCRGRLGRKWTTSWLVTVRQRRRPVDAVRQTGAEDSGDLFRSGTARPSHWRAQRWRLLAVGRPRKSPPLPTTRRSGSLERPGSTLGPGAGGRNVAAHRRRSIRRGWPTYLDPAARAAKRPAWAGRTLAAPRGWHQSRPSLPG